MLEKNIERYLYQQCQKRKWLCEKFVSPGKRSVPDRLITVPGGHMFLVELKSPNGKVTELQKRDHERRKKLGIHVYILRNKPMVDYFIHAIEQILEGENVNGSQK